MSLLISFPNPSPERRLNRVSSLTQSATTEIYTLSLHDALPISSTSTATMGAAASAICSADCAARLDQARRSEEHTSELQSRLHLVCRLLLEKKNSIALAARFVSGTSPPPSKPSYGSLTVRISAS